MHGLSSAESVLTDPNFLSNLGKLLATRDAEAEASNEEIRKAIADVRASNKVMRVSLNETVLKPLGIEPTSALEVSSGTPDGDDAADVESRSVEQLYTDVMADLERLKALGGRVYGGVSEVVLYGDFLEENLSLLGLSAEQQQVLKRLNQFAQSVMAATNAMRSQESVTEEARVALGLYAAKMQDLIGACNDAKKVAGDLKEESASLRSKVSVDFVKDAEALADNVLAMASKWGEVPELEADAFEMTQQPEASPAMEEPAMAEPAEEELPLKEPAVKEPAVEKLPVEEPAA
jgi:hypothetical protein